MTRIESARLVAAQLGVLATLGALPDLPDGPRLDRSPTPVHDVNGELLLWRIGTCGGRGYVDVAAHPMLGAPLVAVAPEAVWEPEALLAEARARGVEHDELQFVAYSFPKLAVRYLLDGVEVALLELHTWERVPPVRADLSEPPGEFERWSFLDELSPQARHTHDERYRQRREALTHLANVLHVDDPVVRRFDRKIVEQVLKPRVDALELQYSHRFSDQSSCLGLLGQETNRWSSAASAQMVLDFYRYRYDQERLADELGLGTEEHPSGLPASRDFDVVRALENLTGKSLSAAMSTTPTFAEYRSEIRANRPVISFVPGHCRVVTGYTRTSSLLLIGASFAALRVADPWPPKAGVVTRWENVDTIVCRNTVTARVTLVP
ncbi:C39 family peptidase [Umezawaea tangerina]|uniref:Peptidase C39-like protein n=1 Tax=Umezawaea tangerina TaxID=84725 RepID=A0A2T0SC03_9PSEU|nr:C39 family peptidase [Umezawaea tangerina]PRY30955.1 peptidase C39-like protein [Umezawaea tangerina]